MDLCYALWMAFNHDEGELKRSVAKALSMDLAGVLPNHADGAGAEVHL